MGSDWEDVFHDLQSNSLTLGQQSEFAFVIYYRKAIVFEIYNI